LNCFDIICVEIEKGETPAIVISRQIIIWYCLHKPFL